jgi:cell division protease FtsH
VVRHDARKIRAYFKALRKAARAEGGAIGFIEEIDAIGGRRGGFDGGDGPVSSGTGGVVNELLVQLQSFDTAPLGERAGGRLIDWVNGWLPAGSQLAKRPPRYHNILVIAATNRADALDPALLRPGRFDRRLYFDLPNAAGRRELIDYFLAGKAHHPELDAEAMRTELAHPTFGYTPVMIEHLLDESLIWALRGMAAEELWFGESTTGPGGDLVGATGLAAQMVGAPGMTDSLVSFPQGGQAGGQGAAGPAPAAGRGAPATPCWSGRS